MGHYEKIAFFVIIIFICKGFSKPGKLVMIENGIENRINSKECNSGIFFQMPISFQCICITGVWGFYREYCEKPVILVGGSEYCFNMESVGKLTQIALVGSYRYPFESSISYFTNTDFVQLTTYITSSEYKAIDMDALGGWITVMGEKWTLYSDSGESICLTPTTPARRIYCTFAEKLQSEISNDKWNYIVQVKQGCYSNATVGADHCYPIKRANGKEAGCQQPPDLQPCPDFTNDDYDTNITYRQNNATIHPECKLLSGRTPPEAPPITEGWILKPMSEPEPEPPAPNKCGELTRETVKQYWLDPANNECGKSLIETVFRDQLQRFAVTRFDKIFDSRLESLEQMKQLVYRSRDIIKKTCGNTYVPEEFLDVATDAFMMFINEDFFYGVEGAESENFQRIFKSLEKCYKRAKLFVFDTKPLGCDLRKITGTLFLPGETVNITVPDMGKSKNFETLIETAWKIFLNAHSYCYDDFQFPNDHHLFSTLFLELFSRSIYEKWIEPLANKQLYKLILPYFEVMKEIMENLDYCVAAVKHVSKCPVWLQRTSPDAKPIQAGDSIFKTPNREDGNGKNNNLNRRKKRSWINAIEMARKRAALWDGNSFCLQFMEEPSVSLALAGCNEIF